MSHPTWAQSYNAVKLLWQNSCGTGWAVAAQLTHEPLGDVALILLLPSSGEVVEEYFNPGVNPFRKGRKTKRDYKKPKDKRGKRVKRARSQWRAKQARRYEKALALERSWIPGIPDVEGAIAEHLPGAAYIGKRIGGLLPAFFWAGVDIVDPALLAFMFVDVGKNFSFNWSSAIIHGEACRDKGALFADLRQKDQTLKHYLAYNNAFLTDAVNMVWQQAPDLANGELTVCVPDSEGKCGGFPVEAPGVFCMWSGKLYGNDEGVNLVTIAILSGAAEPLVQEQYFVHHYEYTDFSLVIGLEHSVDRYLFSGSTDSGEGNWLIDSSHVQLFGAPGFKPS